MSSLLKLTFKIKFDIFLDLHSFLAYCWGKFIYPFIRDYVNFYTSVRGTFCCKTNIKKQHKLILFYCRVVARSIRNLCHRDAIPAWAVCNAKSLSALPVTQRRIVSLFVFFFFDNIFFIGFSRKSPFVRVSGSWTPPLQFRWWSSMVAPSVLPVLVSLPIFVPNFNNASPRPRGSPTPLPRASSRNSPSSPRNSHRWLPVV